MALSDSRAVQLLVMLSVLGMTQAFLKPEPFMVENGCLPGDLKSTRRMVTTCQLSACSVSQATNSHRAQAERNATIWKCVADKTNITNDSSVDEAKLDAFLETFSTNSSFTDQLKETADACLETMPSEFTADQQGVYILVCIEERFKYDCALRGENSWLCRRVRGLIRYHCWASIRNLVPRDVWLTCRPVSSHKAGFAKYRRPSKDSCPDQYEVARNHAACALNESGLASGDAVNLTAVVEAIRRENDGLGADQLLAVLEKCPGSSADEFLDCWSKGAPQLCLTTKGRLLAELLRPTNGTEDKENGCKP